MTMDKFDYLMFSLVMILPISVYVTSGLRRVLVGL